MSAIDKAAQIGLDVLKNTVNVVGAGPTSLVRASSVTRVEPICLIDSDVIHTEMISEVMQALQSIFTGFYVQAFNYAMNVNKCTAIRHLEKLNPSGPKVSIASILSREEYEFKLPVMESDNSISMEAATGIRPPKAPSSEMGEKNLATVNELSALSVGKLIGLEVEENGNKGTITVSVRLLADEIDSTNLAEIMTGTSKRSLTMKERWYSYRAGDLELIKDLILCRDLVREHKKTLAKDKSGIYQKILERRRKNEIGGVITGNVSLAAASNIVVMSTSTMERIESEVSGKFNDYTTRQRIFNNTYAMIVAVIDKDFERVTFYFDSINGSTSMGRRELKSANKGSGIDIGEVLKAYELGNAPKL